jgi:hypothetical protein
MLRTFDAKQTDGEGFSVHMVKLFTALGALTFAAGFAAADTVTEYTSLGAWDSAVSGVTNYTILAPPFVSDGVVLSTPPINPLPGPIAFGPGTFTTPANLPIIFNDGGYGSGVQYFAASPQAFGDGGPAIANVAFSASSDITALAFTLGASDYSATIDVSVNGSALTPLGFLSGNPPIFLGLTDTSPITDISFTIVNAQYGGGNTNYDPGEIDVIGSYATASAITAPEIDPTSAASGLTLLLGSLVVLRGRPPRIIPDLSVFGGRSRESA